jgi:cobalt-zinc-cadmium efflux system outer membrane protein
MTKRIRILALSLAAALTIATKAQAQQPPGLHLAIKRGFEAAWTRQPEQRAAALRRDASTAALRAAERWSPLPPSLDLNTKTDRFTRNQGSREFEATVSVPLWWPGERSLARAAASAESTAQEARLLAAQWRLSGDVREAYWSYQRVRIERELAEQRKRGAQQLAVDVARRVKAGDLAKADGHQADASVAAADAAAAEAMVTLSQAAQRWTGLTGHAIDPAGEPGPEPFPATLASDALHPVLRELATKVEVARRQRDLAGAQTLSNPELSLGAARERGEFGERYSQSVVVGVRIPLGTNAASETRKAAASADQLEAESELSLAQERVQGDLSAAVLRVDTLRAALAAAERRAALTIELRGFFEKSFRAGETDLPTRLRVEHETFEADRQAARSRVELAAAISSLRQAAGLLPE